MSIKWIRTALRAIVARELDGPLDLVIDDASHLCGDTKTSFEILFPLVREGGLYVIEDWPWEFVEDEGIRAQEWFCCKRAFPPCGASLPRRAVA